MRAHPPRPTAGHQPASWLAAAICLAAASCSQPASKPITAQPVAVAPQPVANAAPTPGQGSSAAARAGAGLPPAPVPEVMSINLEALAAMQASGTPPLLVDARMAVLYHLAHLPGAINLPAGRREAAFPKVREQIRAAQADGRRVVFYCVDAHCPDATHTALFVASQGFSGLLVYPGGIDEWKQVGLPLE